MQDKEEVGLRKVERETITAIDECDAVTVVTSEVEVAWVCVVIESAGGTFVYCT